MPMRPFAVDLTGVGETQVIDPGVRISGFTFTEIPSGISVRVRFGGNQPTSPISTPGAFQGLGSSPDQDTKQGVFIVNDVGAPGSFVRGFVSFSDDATGVTKVS